MGAVTGIEWTDATWNPLRGCSRVSEGCRNCYAERDALRWSGPGQPFEGLAVIRNGHASWTGKVELIEKHLLDPLRWRQGRPVYDEAVVDLDGKPKRVGRDTKQSRRIFVNSMSDLFHESVPDEWIDKIFAVMALCPQHTFQVLTKRPKRMLAYLTTGPRPSSMSCPRENHVFNTADFLTRAGAQGELFRGAAIFLEARIQRKELEWPLSNVWLGVSVENQKAATDRVLLLMQTPAAKRFLSVEPMLGPVDLREIECADEDGRILLNALSGVAEVLDSDSMDIISDDPSNPKLDWVICGGESGPGARPMDVQWARWLRDQCTSANVPFFFKQWGEWLGAGQEGKPFSFGDECGQHLNSSDEPIRAGKKAAGALLDGVEYRQFPAAR